MKPIRMAILGAGTIAHTMSETITQMEDVIPYAVASRSRERSEEFIKKYGYEIGYDSYEDMVRDDNIDLVYVATPHSLHFEHAALCLEHGRAVLCEKPFTVNAAQARTLFELAEKKGVLITEAAWPRYMPMSKTLREMIDGGVIGTPTMIEASLGCACHEKPRMREPELAGGALLDLGIYPLTFASILFGNDIESITSTCTLLDTGVDAMNSITLRYRDGRLAVLASSMYNTTSPVCRVHGTEGSLVVSNANNYKHIQHFPPEGPMIEEFDAPEQITGFEYEVQACVDALRQGRTECPDMPHAETLRMMELMDGLRAQWGVRYPFE